jgi:hypothetical protein
MIAVSAAPGPEVRQVHAEAQVERRALHAVEKVEAVAPLFEVLHALVAHDAGPLLIC